VNITRVLTVLLMTVLIVGGWFSMISSNELKAVSMSDEERMAKIAVAEEYTERGLYQKAILEYEAITAEYDREEDWEKLLAVYQLRYEEDEHIRGDFFNAAKKAVRHHPANVSMCMTLVNLCVQYREYSAAYQYAQMTKNAGGSGEEFDRMYREVAYSFVGSDTVYTEVGPEVNKCFAVREGDFWGIIKSNGKNYCARKYSFVSGVGENGVYVRCDGDENVLIDDDDIVQGKLNFVPEDSGFFAENLIPLKQRGTWTYYDELGDEKFGSYEAAGTFSDGKAAVCKNGKWFLINKDGEPVSSVYDDIVLSSDGTWNRDGVIIAALDGVYRLYDMKEKPIGDLKAEEMDSSESGMIAYKSGDKWGYANAKGENVISPVYEEARSFSNGLAAIKVGKNWGFINVKGEIAIEPQFSEVGYFSKDGSCMVKTIGTTWFLITLNNVEVLK